MVAAQGGAPRREPTGFKLIKERMVRDVVVLAPTTAEAASQGPPAVGANGGASAPAASGNPSNGLLPGAQHIFAKSLSEVTPVDVNMAEKREVAASREAQARASRIGVGVTETGQEIFEALSKTCVSAILAVQRNKILGHSLTCLLHFPRICNTGSPSVGMRSTSSSWMR